MKPQQKAISSLKNTKLDEPIFVGIDVSKLTLDVFVKLTKKAFNFTNDEDGIKKLVKQLKPLSPKLVVMEATGGMEKAVAKELYLEEIKVAVINPKQARDFAKATGKLAKTDRLDASILAHFAEAIQPEARKPKDGLEEKLTALTVRRAQLIQMLTVEKNRLSGTIMANIKGQIESSIMFLKKQLKEVDKEIDKHIDEYKPFTRKMEIISSVKGVGRITAVALISELPELGKASKKEIAALAGLAPFNRDSGMVKGTRAIWGGRERVRTALYMAIISCIRCNPVIRAFYNRLKKAGKKTKVALVACMHKLIIILNTIVKMDTLWEEKCSSTDGSI